MIVLTPYNPEWPEWFQKEKAKILNQLPDIKIEHIGSTAIPGIQAKPVIDIMIGVDDLSLFTSSHMQKLTEMGYRYRPDLEETLPFRRFFQKDNAQGQRSHQIHLVNYPSAWWEKHILFRDYLRHHPTIAQQYEKQKLLLAQHFDDTQSYATAKTEFCQHIDKLAFYDVNCNHPMLETERARGFIPQLACFSDYYAMLQDKTFIACYGVIFDEERAKQRVIADIAHWDQYRFGPWMWYDKVQNDFIGRTGLRKIQLENQPEVELAYAINPAYWGKGIAIEMSLAAIDYAFLHLKLDNLICFTLTTNVQSLRVMEKLGFSYEKEFVYHDLPHKLYRMKNKYLSK